MLIIIEGPDLCGKTFLARRLVEDINSQGQVAEYLHASAPKSDDAHVEYLLPLKWYVPGDGASAVIDRWHIGEAVWPRVFGRPSIMGPRDFDDIEYELKFRGALLVRCERPVRTLAKDLRTKRDEPISDTQASEVLWAFDAAYRRSILWSVTYCMDENMTDRSARSREVIIATARAIEQTATRERTRRTRSPRRTIEELEHVGW